MAITINLLRGLALTTPFLLHLFVADVLISLLLPVSVLFPGWTYTLSSHIAASVWSHIQHIFVYWNGARIQHSSPDAAKRPGGIDEAFTVPKEESAIVICNHLSWTDFYLLQSFALSTKPNSMLPYARYFAKSSLRFVPLLGWGLWALRMPLVSRRWADDQAEIARVFKGPRERDEPIWLVMFSEGTRWTKRKWEESVAWARSKNRPEPGKCVLAPRSKGFIASVKGLRNGGVHSVIDTTLAYASRQSGSWIFMKAPSMWETLSAPNLGNDYAFWIHTRRFDVAGLPSDDQGLEQWLEKRWQEKGERLDHLSKSIESGKDVEGLKL